MVMLIENYFYNDFDVVIMQELSGLSQDYSFANKTKLLELIKIINFLFFWSVILIFFFYV
jgi:hypothetical protein